ncbi:MAG: DUF4176 domain-containing protein [Streptococcaceae bacterium]|jgi:hypothetical protein|nr:DUF4176 domain-containing protein [Streptococcaceae bacterium]
MNTTQLLPLGSIVYLKEGTEKVIIAARGQLVQAKELDDKPTYYDYMGNLYPSGFDVKNTYYFTRESIEKVIFTGYQDEEETRYTEVLEEWQEDNSESFVLPITTTEKQEGVD